MAKVIRTLGVPAAGAAGISSDSGSVVPHESTSVSDDSGVRKGHIGSLGRVLPGNSRNEALPRFCYPQFLLVPNFRVLRDNHLFDFETQGIVAITPDPSRMMPDRDSDLLIHGGHNNGAGQWEGMPLV